MTHLLLAVMGQAKYVCAVHRFIQDLLLKAAPELLKGSGALKTDAEFKDTIDAAIASVTTPAARERDYIRAIVEAASDEMKPLCHLLRGASEVVGLGKVADRYLDGARFREMLLRKDEEKLERLNAIVQDQAQAVPVKVLMDVAAELDGRAENYDGMDAASKRKASREMKKLIGKVEEMRSAIDAVGGKIDDHDANTKKRFDDVRDELHETKEELMAKVDAILKKAGKVNFGGKRKCRHTAEQKRVCLALWMEAQRNEELKSGTENGKATHEAAFNWYKRQLSLVGVDTPEKFKAVIHTVNNTNSAESIKALEAKREAERKRKTCKR